MTVLSLVGSPFWLESARRVHRVALLGVTYDAKVGPDTYVGYLVSTLQGSTETTFYVLAVYFGSIQVRRFRHALAAGLTADLAGIVGAVIGKQDATHRC